MAIQLTPEQEQRLQAVVNAGAYASATEALDAALSVVENAAAHDFEGTQDELEGLLMEGLASKELSEEEFWHSVDSQTNAMLAASKGLVGRPIQDSRPAQARFNNLSDLLLNSPFAGADLDLERSHEHRAHQK